MKSFTRFFVFVAALSLMGAGVYGFFRKSSLDEPKRAPETATLAQGSVIDLKDVQLLDAMNKEYVGLVKRVVPSVVSINTSRRENRPNLMVDQFGRVFRGQGAQNVIVPNSLGSGVIVSKEGHI